MKKFSQTIFIFCGLLMLAAFPVFGQNENSTRKMKFNKKPIYDLTKYVIQKIDEDKVDLTQPFKVVLEGYLIKKSENDSEIVILDQNKSKFIIYYYKKEEAGNGEVSEIAKRSILATSENGFFGYLYNLGIKDFTITLYQDDNKLALNLESEQETLEKAKTLASGLNAVFSMGKIAAKSEDEKFLLNGIQTPFAKEKVLFLNIELSKNTVHEIINRNLSNFKNRKYEIEN